MSPTSYQTALSRDVGLVRLLAAFDLLNIAESPREYNPQI
jgi:hypothetical protein